MYRVHLRQVSHLVLCLVACARFALGEVQEDWCLPKHTLSTLGLGNTYIPYVHVQAKQIIVQPTVDDFVPLALVEAHETYTEPLGEYIQGDFAMRTGSNQPLKTLHCAMDSDLPTARSRSEKRIRGLRYTMSMYIDPKYSCNRPSCPGDVCEKRYGTENDRCGITLYHWPYTESKVQLDIRIKFNGKSISPTTNCFDPSHHDGFYKRCYWVLDKEWDKNPKGMHLQADIDFLLREDLREPYSQHPDNGPFLPSFGMEAFYQADHFKGSCYNDHNQHIGIIHVANPLSSSLQPLLKDSERGYPSFPWAQPPLHVLDPLKVLEFESPLSCVFHVHFEGHLGSACARKDHYIGPYLRNMTYDWQDEVPGRYEPSREDKGLWFQSSTRKCLSPLTPMPDFQVFDGAGSYRFQSTRYSAHSLNRYHTGEHPNYLDRPTDFPNFLSYGVGDWIGTIEHHIADDGGVPPVLATNDESIKPDGWCPYFDDFDRDRVMFHRTITNDIVRCFDCPELPGKLIGITPFVIPGHCPVTIDDQGRTRCEPFQNGGLDEDTGLPRIVCDLRRIGERNIMNIESTTHCSINNVVHPKAPAKSTPEIATWHANCRSCVPTSSAWAWTYAPQSCRRPGPFANLADGLCSGPGLVTGTASVNCLECKVGDPEDEDPTAEISGEFVPIAGRCFISDKCLSSGDQAFVNPKPFSVASCYKCLPEISQTAWAFEPTTCRATQSSLVGSDICFKNSDVLPAHLQCLTCTPDPTRRTEEDSGKVDVDPGHCFIDGKCYASGANNPARPDCEYCNPQNEETTFSWSVKPGWCSIKGSCYRDSYPRPVDASKTNGLSHFYCMSCQSTFNRREWSYTPSSCRIESDIEPAGSISSHPWDNPSLDLSPDLEQYEYNFKCLVYGQQDYVQPCKSCRGSGSTVRFPSGGLVNDDRNPCDLGQCTVRTSHCRDGACTSTFESYAGFAIAPQSASQVEEVRQHFRIDHPHGVLYKAFNLRQAPSASLPPQSGPLAVEMWINYEGRDILVRRSQIPYEERVHSGGASAKLYARRTQLLAELELVQGTRGFFRLRGKGVKLHVTTTAPQVITEDLCGQTLRHDRATTNVDVAANRAFTMNQTEHMTWTSYSEGAQLEGHDHIHSLCRLGRERAGTIVNDHEIVGRLREDEPVSAVAVPALDGRFRPVSTDTHNPHGRVQPLAESRTYLDYARVFTSRKSPVILPATAGPFKRLQWTGPGVAQLDSTTGRTIAGAHSTPDGQFEMVLNKLRIPCGAGNSTNTPLALTYNAPRSTASTAGAWSVVGSQLRRVVTDGLVLEVKIYVNSRNSTQMENSCSWDPEGNPVSTTVITPSDTASTFDANLGWAPAALSCVTVTLRALSCAPTVQLAKVHDLDFSLIGRLNNETDAKWHQASFRRDFYTRVRPEVGDVKEIADLDQGWTYSAPIAHFNVAGDGQVRPGDRLSQFVELDTELRTDKTEGQRHPSTYSEPTNLWPVFRDDRFSPAYDIPLFSVAEHFTLSPLLAGEVENLIVTYNLNTSVSAGRPLSVKVDLDFISGIKPPVVTFYIGDARDMLSVQFSLTETCAVTRCEWEGQLQPSVLRDGTFIAVVVARSPGGTLKNLKFNARRMVVDNFVGVVEWGLAHPCVINGYCIAHRQRLNECHYCNSLLNSDGWSVAVGQSCTTCSEAVCACNQNAVCVPRKDVAGLIGGVSEELDLLPAPTIPPVPFVPSLELPSQLISPMSVPAGLLGETDSCSLLNDGVHLNGANGTQPQFATWSSAWSLGQVTGPRGNPFAMSDYNSQFEQVRALFTNLANLSMDAGVEVEVSTHTDKTLPRGSDIDNFVKTTTLSDLGVGCARTAGFSMPVGTRVWSIVDALGAGAPAYARLPGSLTGLSEAHVTGVDIGLYFSPNGTKVTNAGIHWDVSDDILFPNHIRVPNGHVYYEVSAARVHLSATAYLDTPVVPAQLGTYDLTLVADLSCGYDATRDGHYFLHPHSPAPKSYLGGLMRVTPVRGLGRFTTAQHVTQITTSVDLSDKALGSMGTFESIMEITGWLDRPVKRVCPATLEPPPVTNCSTLVTTCVECDVGPNVTCKANCTSTWERTVSTGPSCAPRVSPVYEDNQGVSHEACNCTAAERSQPATTPSTTYSVKMTGIVKSSKKVNILPGHLQLEISRFSWDSSTSIAAVGNLTSISPRLPGLYQEDTPTRLQYNAAQDSSVVSTSARWEESPSVNVAGQLVQMNVSSLSAQHETASGTESSVAVAQGSVRLAIPHPFAPKVATEVTSSFDAHMKISSLNGHDLEYLVLRSANPQLTTLSPFPSVVRSIAVRSALFNITSRVLTMNALVDLSAPVFTTGSRTVDLGTLGKHDAVCQLEFSPTWDLVKWTTTVERPSLFAATLWLIPSLAALEWRALKLVSIPGGEGKMAVVGDLKFVEQESSVPVIVTITGRHLTSDSSTWDSIEIDGLEQQSPLRLGEVFDLLGHLNKASEVLPLEKLVAVDSVTLNFDTNDAAVYLRFSTSDKLSILADLFVVSHMHARLSVTLGDPESEPSFDLTGTAVFLSARFGVNVGYNSGSWRLRSHVTGKTIPLGDVLGAFHPPRTFKKRTGGAVMLEVLNRFFIKDLFFGASIGKSLRKADGRRLFFSSGRGGLTGAEHEPEYMISTIFGVSNQDRVSVAGITMPVLDAVNSTIHFVASTKCGVSDSGILATVDPELFLGEVYPFIRAVLATESNVTILASATKADLANPIFDGHSIPYRRIDTDGDKVVDDLVHPGLFFPLHFDIRKCNEPFCDAIRSVLPCVNTPIQANVVAPPGPGSALVVKSDLDCDMDLKIVKVEDVTFNIKARCKFSKVFLTGIVSLLSGRLKMLVTATKNAKSMSISGQQLGGVVKEPYGIPRLYLGNIFLSARKPGPPINGLGGTLVLGPDCFPEGLRGQVDTRCVYGTGMFDLGIGKDETFLYANTTRLTLPKAMRALFGVNVPEMPATTGAIKLTGNTTFSFSLIPRKLPGFDGETSIHVPAGAYLKTTGTLWNARVVIEASLPFSEDLIKAIAEQNLYAVEDDLHRGGARDIFIRAQTQPISLLKGMVVITKEKDSKEGPFIEFKATLVPGDIFNKPPNFQGVIQGHLRFLKVFQMGFRASVGSELVEMTGNVEVLGVPATLVVQVHVKSPTEGLISHRNTYAFSLGIDATQFTFQIFNRVRDVIYEKVRAIANPNWLPEEVRSWDFPILGAPMKLFEETFGALLEQLMQFLSKLNFVGIDKIGLGGSVTPATGESSGRIFIKGKGLLFDSIPSNTISLRVSIPRLVPEKKDDENKEREAVKDEIASVLTDALDDIVQVRTAKRLATCGPGDELLPVGNLAKDIFPGPLKRLGDFICMPKCPVGMSRKGIFCIPSNILDFPGGCSAGKDDWGIVCYDRRTHCKFVKPSCIWGDCCDGEYRHIGLACMRGGVTNKFDLPSFDSFLPWGSESGIKFASHCPPGESVLNMGGLPVCYTACPAHLVAVGSWCVNKEKIRGFGIPMSIDDFDAEKLYGQAAALSDAALSALIRSALPPGIAQDAQKLFDELKWLRDKAPLAQGFALLDKLKGLIEFGGLGAVNNALCAGNFF